MFNYKPLFLTVLLLTLTACAHRQHDDADLATEATDTFVDEAKSESQTNTENSNTGNARLQQGTYLTILPCTGCKTVRNIRINLFLGDDGRYDKSEEFLGSNRIDFEQGQYVQQGNLLLLQPDSNVREVSIINRFLIKGDKLQWVNADGSVPHPDPRYLLEKKD